MVYCEKYGYTPDSDVFAFWQGSLQTITKDGATYVGVPGTNLVYATTNVNG